MQKMNKIVNKFLLAGYKYMPEMHLRQPGCTYSACGLFTKNNKRSQKFKETGDSWYIYQNELDKAGFQHGMAYGDFKDLTRRIAFENILQDKAFNIVKIPKYDGYQRGLVSMVYTFSDKKTSGSGINENMSDQQLAEELHKPIITQFIKRKVDSTFIDNIWGTDLADKQLSKFNKEFRFLLCVIDIYSIYVSVIPLKDKKGITITNAFQKTLDELKCKPSKTWVDKGSEFYNRSIKSSLEKMS